MSILDINTDIVSDTVQERYLFGQPYGDNINEFIIKCDENDNPAVIGKLVAKAPCLPHAKYDYADIHKNYAWSVDEVFSKDRKVRSQLIRNLQKEGWKIPSISWYEALLGNTFGKMVDSFYFGALLKVFERIEGAYPKTPPAGDYVSYIPDDFWTNTWYYEDQLTPWSKPSSRRAYAYVSMTRPDMLFASDDIDLREGGIRNYYIPAKHDPGEPEYEQRLSLLMIKNV